MRTIPHLSVIERSFVPLIVALAGCDREPVTPGAESRPVTPEPVASAAPLAANDPLRAPLADVAQRVMASVVSVASTRTVPAMRPELPFDDPWFRRFFGPELGPEWPLPFPGPPEDREQRGLGSGVIVAPGVILTNAHVVEGAKELEITGQNKEVLQAELVGADPKSDLAVLKIKGTTSLPALEFGDSARLRPADIVLAIGNPFGVGQTVTMGIVSAKGRANLGIVDYEDFIQTDAAINPGNSGGALVDVEGRLVGIPTAILSRSGGYMGIGFAIPSNMAKPIMTSLLEHGRVTRGYLGVTIQEVSPALAKALGLPNTDGVLISDVEPGSPAAKAGLRRSDVVLSVGGQVVRSTGELRNVVANAPVGKDVEVVVSRGGRRETVRVKIGEMPASTADKPASPGTPSKGDAGLLIAPLDESARRRFQVPSSVKQGVVVSAVEPGSPAARAGLRPGDVILELGQQPVGSPQQFKERWSKVTGTTPLLVLRDGRTLYVALAR